MRNGRHRHLAIGILAAFLSLLPLTVSPVQAVDVQLAWDPSPDPQVTGYMLYYGMASGQYSVSVDTGPATGAALSGLEAAQTYYFAALAYDAAGEHSPFSNEVNYTVPDTTPPSVAITAPVTGTMVQRGALVTISATAADDVGVTQVAFSVNGNLKCTDATSPYTCAWRVPWRTGRTYRLQAKAYDAGGNVGLSGLIMVTSQ